MEKKEMINEKIRKLETEKEKVEEERNDMVSINKLQSLLKRINNNECLADFIPIKKEFKKDFHVIYWKYYIPIDWEWRDLMLEVERKINEKARLYYTVGTFQIQ